MFNLKVGRYLQLLAALPASRIHYKNRLEQTLGKGKLLTKELTVLVTRVSPLKSMGNTVLYLKLWSARSESGGQSYKLHL